MTWSKIVSYIFNLLVTAIIWNYFIENNVDQKIAGGLYAAYVLVYMFLSDLLSKLDKGTSLSRALAEIKIHKGKISKYEGCMLQVHDEVVICLRDSLKGAALKHSLSAITMKLSAIAMNAENDPNDVPSKPTSPAIQQEIQKIDLFIAGQSRE